MEKLYVIRDSIKQILCKIEFIFMKQGNGKNSCFLTSFMFVSSNQNSREVRGIFSEILLRDLVFLCYL